MESSQLSQPSKPLSNRDISALHIPMLLSMLLPMQPFSHSAMQSCSQPLQPWRVPSLHSLWSHCSVGDVSAILLSMSMPIAAIQSCSHAVMQPCSQPLQPWKVPSFTVFEVTAAIKISQLCSYSYPCLLQPFSYAAMQPCNHLVMQPLQPWRVPSLRSHCSNGDVSALSMLLPMPMSIAAIQPCSHFSLGEFLASAASAATAAMEMS